MVVSVGKELAAIDGMTVGELREKYAGLGYEVVGGTSKQFTEHVRRELAKWADVVKRAGIKVE